MPLASLTEGCGRTRLVDMLQQRDSSFAAAQPKSLLIKPASGDCNLHCSYCFYHDRPTDPYQGGTRRRMNNETLEILVRQGMQLDRRQATFGWQGGEPTLCGLAFFERVVALQQQYGYPSQSVSNGLQTNGLLIDEDWARFLRQYSFLLGVSLDGPAEYHDLYRRYTHGGGSHARVWDALRLLTQYEVEFNILSVVNNVTGDHAAEIYDYFVDAGFHFLQFIPCVEVDPHTGKLAEFSVRPQQFGDFLCEVFDRWYNGGNPTVSIRDFDAILSVYLGQPAPLCCYQRQCGGYLVVEYNGDMYPCDFMVTDDLYLGNIGDMSLEQAFETATMRRFAEQKAEARQECLVCAWLPLCQQGCSRFVGLEGQPHHYLCRAYQQFFAHSYAGFMTLRDRLLPAVGAAGESIAPPVQSVGRNHPCPCGSGKKFKQCCAPRRPAWHVGR